MTSKLTDYSQLNQSVLRLLFWLRCVAVLLQISVLYIAVAIIEMPLQLVPLGIIIALLCVWNLVLGIRLRKRRAYPYWEITLNLLVDMLALAGLFYFAGGSTNPFVSLFIVPVALGAVFLPAYWLIALVLFAVACYSLLLEWYVPLPHVLHTFFADDFHFHVVGMWANFIFSAAIIAFFVYVMARRSRKYQEALSATRERLLRNQHINRLGILAASAAHELNTPLASIGMLADELQETANSADAREDVNEIKRQVEACRHHLKQLQGQAESPHARPMEEALPQLLNAWMAAHPEIELQRQLQDLEVLMVSNELELVIDNVLDNAAEASLQTGRNKIEFVVARKSNMLEILIKDSGSGMSQEQLDVLGKSMFSDKPEGMGVGLMLSQASLESLGGSLQLEPMPKGGTQATLKVPIRSLGG
ncbi:MAG: ATP-binding protein [bacterium]